MKRIHLHFIIGLPNTRSNYSYVLIPSRSELNYVLKVVSSVLRCYDYGPVGVTDGACSGGLYGLTSIDRSSIDFVSGFHPAEDCSFGRLLRDV